MNPMLARAIHPLALAVVVSGALAPMAIAPASIALAQSPTQQVVDLNRRAMDAYTNLEIDQANTLLNQALELAQRSGVTGAPLARVYMNLGVVAIAGHGDNGAGLTYFTQALAADPNVQLDPLTTTPDIETTFALARARASSQGQTQTQQQTQAQTQAQMTGEGAPSGGLRHTPSPEQLVRTAVPVYVEASGRPAAVAIFYRGHGMREFRRAEMTRVSAGYGFEIPCDDVFEPEVFYYIVAFDASGAPTASAGSREGPIRVPIVTSRTEAAPALPGRAPPSTCADHECPPGMPNCQARASSAGGTATLGQVCGSDAECLSGNCHEGLCAAGDEGEESDDDRGMGRAPRFFARATFGVGLSWVESGMRADRFVCAPGDPGCADSGLPHEVAPEPFGLGPNQFTPDDFAANGYVPHSGTTDFGASLTTSCGYSPTDYGACVFVASPGMAANFQMRLEVGYYFLEWLGASVFTRIQPLAGVGTLAPALIGARVHFRVYDEGRDEGLWVSVHVGGSAGQIQAQVPRVDSQVAQPWIRSGLGGLHFGSNVGFRIVRNFGIVFNPDFMFQFPDFMFTLDMAVGAEVVF